MKRLNRLDTNDKVEVIDSESEYFGKIGKVIEIKVVPVRVIDVRGKTTSSGEEMHIVVKLDETATEIVLTKNQFRKI